MPDATTTALLRAHLGATVPLTIHAYLSGQRPWPDARRRDELVYLIAAHGDSLLFRTRYTAETASALAEVVAILAFAPGGVTFLGEQFAAPQAQVKAFFGQDYAVEMAALRAQMTVFEAAGKETDR